MIFSINVDCTQLSFNFKLDWKLLYFKEHFNYIAFTKMLLGYGYIYIQTWTHMNIMKILVIYEYCNFDISLL